MSAGDRILDLLPPPYAVADDAVLTRVVEAFGSEIDVLIEDVDRLRQTHWAQTAYAMADLTRLALLVAVEPLPGEMLQSFRVRLLALVDALIDGALGPHEIRGFVHAFLAGAERALQSTFVPGLGRYGPHDAFEHDDDHPAYRPLSLVEWPRRLRRSAALAARGGRVPYLHRWQERNGGLDPGAAAIAITGLGEGRTAVPVLVNLTTGDLVGYAGVIGFGRRLTIEAPDPASRTAVVRLDHRDVSQRAFSVSGFQLGTPLALADRDPVALVPRMGRGDNDWLFLSVGHYEVPGLDRVFFAIADDDLREGVFDKTRYDHALYPSGDVARLEMSWEEVEGAAFEIRIPSGIIAAAPELRDLNLREALQEAIVAAIDRLHAAGVRAEVVFEPFVERQEQHARTTLPWQRLEPEIGPSGEGERLVFGARYGDGVLDYGRFG